MASSSVSSLDNALPASFSEKWCRTQVKVNKTIYTWTISNFTFCREQTGEALKSSSFSTGENDSTKWILCAYPNGTDVLSADYLSLFLKLCSSEKADVRAKFKFSILDAKREEKKTYSVENIHKFVPSSDWGFQAFVKRSTLLETVNGLLPDDKLTIYCEIFVIDDSVNASGPSNCHCKVPKCTLLNDFVKLFDNPKFSDVIVSVNGKEFFAHKNILSSRSPVFAAMFEHDTMEKRNSRVEIVDMDPMVFKEILRFIYTGEVSDLDEIAMDLLPASETYALDRLKAMCENALYSKISVEAVSDALVVADRYNADQLKTHALDFICKHATSVTETNSWNLMVIQYPHLVAEVIKALATQQTPLVNQFTT